MLVRINISNDGDDDVVSCLMNSNVIFAVDSIHCDAYMPLSLQKSCQGKSCHGNDPHKNDLATKLYAQKLNLYYAGKNSKLKRNPQKR